MDDEHIELSEAAKRWLEVNSAPGPGEFPLYEIDEEAEPLAEVAYEEITHDPYIVYDCNEKTGWVPQRVKDS